MVKTENYNIDDKHKKNDKHNDDGRNFATPRRVVHRKRRGVGAIIGGTILAAILFGSVFIYFLVMMQSENARGKQEVQALQIDDQKKAENLVLSTYSTPNGFLMNQSQFLVQANNTGPIAVRS